MILVPGIRFGLDTGRRSQCNIYCQYNCTYLVLAVRVYTCASTEPRYSIFLRSKIFTTAVVEACCFVTTADFSHFSRVAMKPRKNTNDVSYIRTRMVSIEQAASSLNPEPTSSHQQSPYYQYQRFASTYRYLRELQPGSPSTLYEAASVYQSGNLEERRYQPRGPDLPALRQHDEHKAPHPHADLRYHRRPAYRVGLP